MTLRDITVYLHIILHTMNSSKLSINLFLIKLGFYTLITVFLVLGLHTVANNLYNLYMVSVTGGCSITSLYQEHIIESTLISSNIPWMNTPNLAKGYRSLNSMVESYSSYTAKCPIERDES